MKTLSRITVLFVILSLAGTVLAQPPLPEIEGAEIIASGFNGPQGVLVDDEGGVWVIDSGLGGEEDIQYVSPETGEAIDTRMGPTARIVMISPDGEQTEVTTLPSLVAGEMEMLGGARLALLDGVLYATTGGWIGGVASGPPDLMGVVARVEGGMVSTVADLWAFEEANNPDGLILEAHPYGIAAGPDGWLWVADAGANALLRVDPASGAIELVAAFEEGLPGGFPNPNRKLHQLFP